MTQEIIDYANIKIKEEPEEELEQFRCKICIKSFYSMMAIVNHARMEHFQAYSTGDVDSWMETVCLAPQPEKVKIKLEQSLVKAKTELMLSSMVPTSLTSLAAKNVEYIIIKGDPNNMVFAKRKRDPAPKKPPPPKVQKKPEAITGPFECLQPSNLNAEVLCHQIFFSCCQYSLHYRDEHSHRRKSNRCQVCEKFLGTITNPDAPFSCASCGEGFDDNASLVEHSLVHMREKPYECNICTKRFTAAGGLQQHLRSHTGQRPYKCTMCDKAFTQKSGVDQHLRTHTKEKPYRCLVCSKRFCQSVHLRQHMRTHTNVQPFQCVLCQKRFKQSSHLNYHLKSHGTSDLSDEQRKKYSDILDVLYKKGAECEVMCASQDGNGVYTLEVQELSQEELENQHVIEVNTLGETERQQLIEQGVLGEHDYIAPEEVEDADQYEMEEGTNVMGAEDAEHYEIEDGTNLRGAEDAERYEMEDGTNVMGGEDVEQYEMEDGTNMKGAEDPSSDQEAPEVTEEYIVTDQAEFLEEED